MSRQPEFEKTRQKRARNMAPTIESNKRWSERNRERVRLIGKAGRKLRHAVAAGKIARPTTCSKCGGVGAIEAAHSDYTRPFDVVWLCVFCHRKWDHAAPKSAQP